AITPRYWHRGESARPAAAGRQAKSCGGYCPAGHRACGRSLGQRAGRERTRRPHRPECAAGPRRHQQGPEAGRPERPARPGGRERRAGPGGSQTAAGPGRRQRPGEPGGHGCPGRADRPGRGDRQVIRRHGSRGSRRGAQPGGRPGPVRRPLGAAPAPPQAARAGGAAEVASRPGRAMTVQPAVVSYQGHYAGSASRFTAYAIDLVVSSAVFSLALAAISYGVHIVTGHNVNWNRSNIVVAVLFVLWQFVYFGYSWAVSGRTFGMAALGIRVVAADGSVLEPRRGVVRALVFPLSFLLFGLGFLGILVQREHRALHDLIAGTAVIYAWDARAAHLRFLARQADLVPGARPPAGR